MATDKLQSPIFLDRDLYKAIGELLDFGIWKCDAQGRNIYASDSFLKLLGVTQEQVSDFGWTQMLHPSEAQEAVAAWKECVHTGKAWSKRLLFRGIEGKWHPILSRGVPLRNEEGEITGWVGIHLDISHLKEFEENRWRLASIVDSSDDAIISRDLNGIITSWNDGAERIFGYKAQEVVGKPVSLLVPENRQNEEPSILERIRKGERIDHYETIRKRKDGSLISISLTVSPIKNPSGVVIGASKIARDITDQLKAKSLLLENENRLHTLTEALTRSNNELEQFAYVASHDLKEPLHVVSSFTYLLERKIQEELGNEEKEYINFIKQGINQAQSLVKDLLEYGRVGGEKEKQITDISSVLREVLINLKISIEDSGAVIKHDPLPKIFANYLGMVRVFQNLIGNSIKYKSKQPPEICISVDSRENEYVFSIQDNGIGIDPKYQSRIFDMFQRLHSKSEYSGSGIGLAICKRVIENHGGTIWVESQAGKGSAFYFTIPKKV